MPISNQPARLTMPKWWCVTEETIDEVQTQLRAIDVSAIMSRPPAHRSSTTLEVVDGVAIIDLDGPLTKAPHFLQVLMGGTATSEARALVEEAAADDSITSIILRIDSPGGEVRGTGDLADAVFEARQRKPVAAFIEDLGASAALHIASQATSITANPSALVGSIGTFAVVRDFSRLMEGAGIKTIVIRAGEFKGTGAVGTEITDEQIAEIERVVTSMNDQFIRAVARGRGMDINRVRELADGRVHIAGDAKRLGLIDRVGTFGEVLAELRSRPGRGSHTQAQARAQATPPASPVSPVTAQAPADPLAELTGNARDKAIIAAFPGVNQLSFGWLDYVLKATSINDARERFTRARSDEAAQKKRKAKTMNTNQPASQPDAVAQWNSAIAAREAQGMSKSQAIRATANADPDLHRRYLAAANNGQS